MYCNYVQKILSWLGDYLFPSRCLVCSTVLVECGLCADCYPTISFTTAYNMCSKCGNIKTATDIFCADCLKYDYVFDVARSVLLYDKNSLGIIHKYKFYNCLYFSKIYARWIVDMWSDFILQYDLLVPVPMHYTSLLSRGYNQSAILANKISRISGVVVDCDVLHKIKRNKNQRGMSAIDRESNVVGVFGLRKGMCIAGKSVLIVDDVFTTGATVNECARVLLSGGACNVGVITIARRIAGDLIDNNQNKSDHHCGGELEDMWT